MVLHIMVGISGSGKSTFVNKHKKENDIVICPDNIRKELTGSISDQSKNKEVFDTAFTRLSKADKDTYFDATSLTTKSLKSIIGYAKQFDKIIIHILSASSNLDLCKRRVREDISKNKDRANVPEEVIDKMHDKFMNLIYNLRNNSNFTKELGNKVSVRLES